MWEMQDYNIDIVSKIPITAPILQIKKREAEILNMLPKLTKQVNMRLTFKPMQETLISFLFNTVR